MTITKIPIADKDSTQHSANRTGTITSATRKEIKPLTSLRFFAALAILLYHGGERFICLQGLHHCYIAEQAVTFFFVLSGFILTYNYVDIKDVRTTVKFYLARFSRIWPAHVVSLLLLVFLMPEVFKVKSVDVPLFLRNLFLLQSWGIPDRHAYFSYNASAWSISTEMFFYLCFPFLLWSMKKRWYLPVAITSCVTALLICFSNFLHLPESASAGVSFQGLLFISPLSSILSFSFGMIASIIWRDRLSRIDLNTTLATLMELSIIAFVCLINVSSSAMRCASAACVGDGGAFWIQNTGSSVLGFALLVVIFAWDKGWISKIIRTPLLVLLGELSFGIYLLHGVLITYFDLNFPQEQSINACLIFLVTLFVSTHLMFEMVEKPMRKLMIKNGLVFIDIVAGRIKSLTSSNPMTPKLETPAGIATGTNRDAAATKLSSANKNILQRRSLLLLEALAFAVFIYFSLPTIHQLTASEASSMTKDALAKNVILSPYLMCKGALAKVSGNVVSLSLVWEALKPETVNFTVKAVAMDSSGKPLASTTYTQDGRQQWVQRGICWLDRANIEVPAKSAPASISITVLRNKHAVLHSSTAPSDNVSLSVPLLPAATN